MQHVFVCTVKPDMTEAHILTEGLDGDQSSKLPNSWDSSSSDDEGAIGCLAHPLSGGVGCECGFRSSGHAVFLMGWNLIQSWKMIFRHRSVGNQLDSQWSSVWHNPVATYADSSCACRSLGTKLQKAAKSATMKNTNKLSGYCRSNLHIAPGTSKFSCPIFPLKIPYVKFWKFHSASKF